MDIKSMTLAARLLLITEVGEQLEGLYGLLPDGTFHPASDYPVLSLNKEAAITRQQLETLLTDEMETGIQPSQARKKLVAEVAFTWLNRSVAFKMMESRKLIKQSIGKGSDSNGFKLWLTKSGNENHYSDYEAGDLPHDGLGEGPRQRAYRQYILSLCNDLSEEIGVLFELDDIPSRLFPRPNALNELLKLLNDESLTQNWVVGHEDTIGWVYQFFVEEQKKDVFKRLYKKKEKIKAEDIPAATQIFTPRWIVKCLVQNTLGRLWLEMHPDSLLRSKLDYLIPLEIENDRTEHLPKLAKDIKVLDPACGTMHFGLVAFDLLAEMYGEELDRSGSPGWRATPSVRSKEEIPAQIIANNIHGIDIDLRAVQLSALTLFMKAKSLEPKTKLSQCRLACADINMLAGEQLDRFFESADLEEKSIYAKATTLLSALVKDSNQLGSLLRIADEIKQIVAKERKGSGANSPQLTLQLRGIGLVEPIDGSFWDQLEQQLLKCLHAAASLTTERNRSQAFFAREAQKGLRFLEITGQQYDIVLGNPPYLSSRNMNSVLKTYLRKNYKISKGDLYAAFVQRCTEWLKEGGRLGMITQQSFMFISSYEKLRDFLRRRIVIESLPHVGPRAFDEVSGEKVNTTLLVFRRDSESLRRENSVGKYLRLIREPDGEAKRKRFEKALASLQANEPDPIVFQYRQGAFDAIPGAPWVYWITPAIRNLFTENPRLDSVAKACVGLQTGENVRFLRFWWEVGKTRVAFGCKEAKDATESGLRWFPYMKGGSFKRWYGNQTYTVNWWHDGLEIDACKPKSVIRNAGFYFRAGVTWSDLTSGRFSARLSPGGFMFDVKGSSAFSDDPYHLLALLNSTFANYALNLLNPTVSFQVGDIKRLPIPTKSNISMLPVVQSAIKAAQFASSTQETTFDFLSPPNWKTGIPDIDSNSAELARLHQQLDDQVFDLYGISAQDRAAIEQDLLVSEVESDNDSEDEDEGAGEAEDEAIEESEWEPKTLARAWISYAVGIVLGRFQPGVTHAIGAGHFTEDVAKQLRALADADGIVVLDARHPDDMTSKVRLVLQIAVGANDASEIVEAACGVGDMEEQLREYFEKEFFDEHIKKYCKRPVYWLLQSPKKKYSLYVFNERFTKDTLHKIRGEQYVGAKLKQVESDINDLRKKREVLQGKEKREIDKQIVDLEGIFADVKALALKIDEITQRGYTPHIDDGVLINMAPLWELLPSWQKEPKSCWHALMKGDYDWSHQAMDHRPNQVKEACKNNRSFAIAHARLLETTNAKG